MKEAQVRTIMGVLEDHEKRITNLEKSSRTTEKSSSKGKPASAKKMSIFNHLDRLKIEGYFDEPRSLAGIVIKLAEEGYHYPTASLTEPLQRAIRQRVLGRLKKDGKWAYVRR